MTSSQGIKSESNTCFLQLSLQSLIRVKYTFFFATPRPSKTILACHPQRAVEEPLCDPSPPANYCHHYYYYYPTPPPPPFNIRWTYSSYRSFETAPQPINNGCSILQPQRARAHYRNLYADEMHLDEISYAGSGLLENDYKTIAFIFTFVILILMITTIL